MGPRYLTDVLDTMGERGDALKFREVNPFVDHSQIMQRERLPRGIWGTKSLRDRVVTHPGG
jgi:hypothetical protein